MNNNDIVSLSEVLAYKGSMTSHVIIENGKVQFAPKVVAKLVAYWAGEVPNNKVLTVLACYNECVDACVGVNELVAIDADIELTRAGVLTRAGAPNVGGRNVGNLKARWREASTLKGGSPDLPYGGLFYAADNGKLGTIIGKPANVIKYRYVKGDKGSKFILLPPQTAVVKSKS